MGLFNNILGKVSNFGESLSPISSAVSGLIGGIGSLFGRRREARRQERIAKYNADMQYKSAIEATQMQNDANMALMEKNNQFNIDMWNRENEYNSPAAQMDRLREGKVNPALAFSQGVTGNLASSAPQATTIAPDFSRWSAGPEKAYVKMPVIANTVNSVLSVLSNLEDLKQKRMDTEHKGFVNQFLPEYLGSRNRKLLQDYYLSGGDLTEDDAQTIKNRKFKKMYLDNKVGELTAQQLRLANYITAGTAPHIFMQSKYTAKGLKRTFEHIDKKWQWADNYGLTKFGGALEALGLGEAFNLLQLFFKKH